AGGDLQTAIEHLRDTHLKLLLRLGVSLTVDLRKRAERTMAALGLDPARTREVPYLDSPYREALAGFVRHRPQFYGGLDGQGAGAMREFRAMRELFRALLGIDIATPAFRAETAGREIRLGQILITAFARHALEHRLVPAPIEARRRSGAFVGSFLNMLEDDLAELDPRAIDPRFIRSLLVRRG